MDAASARVESSWNARFVRVVVIPHMDKDEGPVQWIVGQGPRIQGEGICIARRSTEYSTDDRLKKKSLRSGDQAAVSVPDVQIHLHKHVIIFPLLTARPDE